MSPASGPPSLSTAREPGWVTHAIWWHLYPLGATGAPSQRPDDAALETQRGQHRLAQLQTWLDYVVRLGASGLMLAPVFESSSHGYDTIDYFHVDPRLGDDDDLGALIAAAHDRGLRVVLDGVFNHVGRDFPLVQKVLQGSASEDERRWFRYEDGDLVVFEGHSGLVVLNHDEPAVAGFVARVMDHWLGRGIDGWRLDAAYAVPVAFWARVLPGVREAHPDAYIFGEVIHGDYPAIVAQGDLGAVTQYELWKAIWSSINDRNFFELAHALERHRGYLDDFVPLTFIGNHDVTRIASRLTETAHLEHALVILMTIGGTPAIYYGDEQGFRGVKQERAGGDDEIRPALPAGGPDQLSGLGAPIHRLHQDLIGLRRRHSWLHRARTQQLELANHTFVYEVSGGPSPDSNPPGSESPGSTDRLCVALNLDDADVTVTVPGWARSLLLTGDSAATLGEPDQVTLPPHGWAIIGPQ